MANNNKKNLKTNTYMNITYGKALALSAILGKSTIKNLGGELFLPVIKAKAALSGIVKKYQELQEAVYKESGISFNADGSVPAGTPIAQLNQVSNALKKLENEPVEIADDITILSPVQLQHFYDENPKLVTAELEVLYEYMVKQE